MSMNKEQRELETAIKLSIIARMNALTCLSEDEKQEHGRLHDLLGFMNRYDDDYLADID